MTAVYFITLACLVIAGYFIAAQRAKSLRAAPGAAFHSLPTYHGLLAAVSLFVPMVLVFAIGTPIVKHLATSSVFSFFPPEVANDPLQRGVVLRDVGNILDGRHQGEPSATLRSAATSFAHVLSTGRLIVLGAGVALGIASLLLVLSRISATFRARNLFERFVIAALVLCALVAILTTIGIVFSVVWETYRFFFDPTLKGRPTVTDFLFGTEWNPQAALRADQGDIKTAYGFIPLLTGTLLITFIAILVAGPLGLFSAIYLSEYATPRFRAWAKPILEILAGIPTVVLGFFAALTVAPLIRGWGESFGLDIASESALAAGLVMGMMIIPFISSLSDDVINAVPQSLRDGAYALGATKSETIKKVVLPAALPGIVSAFMLAISRAIGETMIVVMAAGLAANLTLNPLDAVTTITVQIKTILVGDQEFDSAKTLAAFALGFVLFFVTLVLNIIGYPHMLIGQAKQF
ncbi:MAG: phosphate ABC transporter permease subunit PstC [Hyphomicrobium sp. SCN 65-11]|nr:MAG: phosphate ABC transporter permease subunit PstC [Hyphomicrobium sp. SCN 65-11]